MSAHIDRLKPRDKKTGLINVIIETPAGSRSKFRYDEDTRLFQLDKLLPLGAAFPYDFGFVPGTLAEDGDPLDLVLIGAEATFAGCHVTARLLGVIEAKQTEGRQDDSQRPADRHRRDRADPSARAIDLGPAQARARRSRALLRVLQPGRGPLVRPTRTARPRRRLQAGGRVRAVPPQASLTLSA
jgi:hypothetical protein